MILEVVTWVALLGLVLLSEGAALLTYRFVVRRETALPEWLGGHRVHRGAVLAWAAATSCVLLAIGVPGLARAAHWGLHATYALFTVGGASLAVATAGYALSRRSGSRRPARPSGSRYAPVPGSGAPPRG